MRRQRVIGRIRYLRNLEIWNIVSIPAMLIIVMTQLGITSWRMMVYSILVMMFMFLQGALYWDTKHNSLIQHHVQLPATFRTNFVTFRWFNVFFLSVYPIAATYGYVTVNNALITDWWSHSVYVAAILVYINYYHWQLSHDNPSDLQYLMTHYVLRHSPLYTDLYPVTVTISKPIRMQRSSVVSRAESTRLAPRHSSKSQPLPTVSSQLQPIPASTSQTLPTLSSSQSQPLPTAQSQPYPAVSSQSQPIPTAKSQPMPTVLSAPSQPLSTSQSQPVQTVSSEQSQLMPHLESSQPLPTTQSQPISTVSSQSQPMPTTINAQLLAASITQPLPIITDDMFISQNAPAEPITSKETNETSPKKGTKQASTTPSVKRTPMKSLKETSATDQPPPSSTSKKSSTSRSKTKPKNE